LPETPVIKASGLAAGKGVIVPADHAEAAHALRALLCDRRFGDAGSTVLIEERLVGPELSVLAFCDGATFYLLPAAQDHKRLLDGDQGPNTGGMGAYAPSPLATTALLAEIERTIITPTLAGMIEEGAPYRGILYVGLMLTSDGPKVIEYNCRFGDPETQVILPLLASDLVELILACLDGDLTLAKPRWRKQVAVTIVMAAGGYPEAYASGDEITQVEQAEAAGCLVFHAGTVRHEGRLVTAGGRVLNVSALGDDLAAAAATAYVGVQQIHFANAVYRTDIGSTK
jgi:phosphoribosylamine--glycine ligase